MLLQIRRHEAKREEEPPWGVGGNRSRYRGRYRSRSRSRSRGYLLTCVNMCKHVFASVGQSHQAGTDTDWPLLDPFPIELERYTPFHPLPGKWPAGGNRGTL